MSHCSAMGLKTHHWAAFFIVFFSLAITCHGAALPTDVAIRSKGDVSLIADAAGELEERFNKWVFGVGMSIVAISANWLGVACAATPVTFGIPCLTLLGTFALGSIISVIGASVGGGDKLLLARSAHAHTTFRKEWLAEHYKTGKPVLVAHHDCHGPGCFQSEYSLHTTKEGQVVHRVLTGPHRKNNGTNHISAKERRQTDYQGYGDYTPSGDGQEDEFFLDYLFHITDDTAASDLVAGYDYNSYDDEWSFAGAMDTDLVNSNGQGYYCMNIGEPDYSDGIATSGYAGFFQGEMEQDPDNEDAYIAQCAGEGQTGDYRTYEFDGRK